MRRSWIPSLLLLLLLSAPLRPAQRPSPSTTSTSPASVDPAAPSAVADEWQQYRHDIQRSGRAGAALPTGGDGKLHLQWAYSLGERAEVEVEPIVADGRLYAGAMNGVMSALNLSDGSLAWSYQADGPIAHTAAYANGQLFFGSLDGYVYALDGASGALQWRVQTGGPVYAAPVVANGAVYIGSTAGRLFALSVASGGELWHYPAGTARLATAFTGAAALSPDGQRLYVGNEDLVARAINASSGAELWAAPLSGVGMRGTYPIVADSGQVVIYLSEKPGVHNYQPIEAYPGVADGNNPAQTWNGYYQTYPKRRSTFMLNAATGADLWAPASSPPRYVPLPMPYLGLHEPVLDGAGNAWLVASGGAKSASFGPYILNQDMRLVRMALGTGVATEMAVREQFQQRIDENGRATFAGNDYLTTISEDVGAYRTTTGARTALFGSAGAGFGSHMDPLAPLPSKHVWRYGGTVSIGGVLGASPLVVASGRAYYISYGWIFALGPTNQGKDPTGTAPLDFAARDARAHTLTYPRVQLPTTAELAAELDQRVADLVAAGVRPPLAKFDQVFQPMLYESSTFQLFGTPGETVWTLAQALPHLSPARRAEAETFLKQLVQSKLVASSEYAGRRDCLIHGQSGIKTGEACNNSSNITAAWWADNELLIGERLYALAAYAEATGDWATIDSSWSLITGLFQRFTSAYNSSLGFCVFPQWHVGKLDLPRQIGAAAGVLRMASHRGDSTTAGKARTLLDNLLATRVRLASFIKGEYDAGRMTPLSLTLDADGVPNLSQLFSGYNDIGELIPLSGSRNRSTDTRQLYWQDGSSALYHSGAAFMYYQSLVGYSPLYPELASHLRANLLDATTQYVQSYEVNAPWWWMSDLAHHTTAGGEHLWHSPTLAHDLFQAKAHILNEDWQTLARQLPLPMSINPRYDLYRMHDIATLLDLVQPDLSTSKLQASPLGLDQGQKTRLTFKVKNNGGPPTSGISLTLTLPSGLQFVPATHTASSGSVGVSGSTLSWTGAPGGPSDVLIEVQAQATTSQRAAVEVQAQLRFDGSTLNRKATLVLNGLHQRLPLVLGE